jgi:hypothetical protein
MQTLFKNLFTKKLSINHKIQAGHSILAHSRPDKIGTPRLLPLDIRNIHKGISAKKSAQTLCPAFIKCTLKYQKINFFTISALLNFII